MFETIKNTFTNKIISEPLETNNIEIVNKLPPIEIVEVDTSIIDKAINELANPTEVDILKDELQLANDKIESLQIKLGVAITERDEWKLKYLNK